MDDETPAKEIGGRQWTLALLPAGVGLKVGSRLVRLLGPAIGEAATKLGGNMQQVLDTDVAALGEVLTTLAERLGDPEAADLVKLLVTSGVFCDGKEVNDKNFDLLFRGDYLTLLLVAAWVVQENFRLPFFSLLDGIVAQQGATPTPPSSSPQASAP